MICIIFNGKYMTWWLIWLSFNESFFIYYLCLCQYGSLQHIFCQHTLNEYCACFVWVTIKFNAKQKGLTYSDIFTSPSHKKNYLILQCHVSANVSLQAIQFIAKWQSSPSSIQPGKSEVNYHYVIEQNEWQEETYHDQRRWNPNPCHTNPFMYNTSYQWITSTFQKTKT